MATAGRILILPKGNWDATKTYDNLDLVAHNGKAWLAKKPSVGIAPSEANVEYWHDFLGVLFTAEGMGALPNTGGYISGIFGIVNGEYYTEFHNADGRTYHRIKGSDDNYRDLILGLDIDPSYAITKDGVYSRYKLYGEHNKPGASDVGAIPTSEKGQALFVDDLLASFPAPTLVFWGGDTLNTPFKSGLTNAMSGFGIAYGDSNYHTAIAWPTGKGEMWMHSISGGVASGWVLK